MSQLQRLAALAEAKPFLPRVDPMGRGRRPMSLALRIYRSVAVEDSGCWVWQGFTNGRGYAKVRVGSRADGTATMQQAHRAVYELLVGPIPEGLDLDHLCFNKACVNPDHLEPVTNRENRRRYYARDVCRLGHERTPENTYFNPAGFRCCKQCRRNADARRGKGRGAWVS